MKPWKLYALLAALCNGSTGVFSKTILQLGLNAEQVAFYQSLFAFLLLSIFYLFSPRKFIHVMQLKKDWKKISVCAIFGMFVLYYFETKAYVYIDIATVIFILLGAAAITTSILAKVLLQEKLGAIYLVAMLLAVLGLFFMFRHNGFEIHDWGSLFALIAGIGYGSFITITKKFEIEHSGFDFLWWFVGFGTLFLLLPFLMTHPVLPSLASIPQLLLFSLLPTIGGFFCTIKALDTGEAGGVQLIELSEPVFASLFAFIFFREILSGQQLLGAGLILFAIYLSTVRNIKDD